jgi:pimeloyl-ACP methyl ester carboxylesterase
MLPFEIILPKGRLTAARFNPNGERLCIVLHGYGDNLRTMQNIAEQWTAQNYEVIVFDLPFHGTSHWQSDIYSESDVTETLLFLLKNNTKPFDLIGYSLGGRLVLASITLLAKAQKTPENVWLLATAGAPQNWLHQYIEMPLFLKKIVAKLAENSGFLLKLANFLYKKNIISKFELAFAEKYLGDATRRKMMFAWWFSLAYLQLDFKNINAVIIAKNIKCHLFFGKNDNVLPPNSDVFYIKNLQHTSFKYEEATHRSIINTVFDIK